MSFFGDVFDWFTGSSLSANLAKTAALGYASRLLNDSISDDVKSASASTTEEEDKGVRLQIKANAQSKIPVLYGDAYFGGFLTDLDTGGGITKWRYVLTLSEITGTKLSDSNPSAYTFHDVYLDNQRVVFKPDGITVDYTIDSNGNQDINKRDLIKVYMYSHDPLQPDGYTGTTPAADTIMSTWTALTHPMTGLMYAIVEVTYNRANAVTALPNCTFHMENSMSLPGDVLQDYMTNEVYGAGIPVAEIDTTSLTAVNTYALTGFNYTDADLVAQSGTIEINGLVNTAANVLTNMNGIASAVSSWMSYSIFDGLWSVVINEPGTSVASLSDSNIVGSIDISGTSLTALYNAADVKYQNTDILDKTDFVKLEIPPAELYENEPFTALQITLPFTNQQAVALKVGLVGINQSRIDKIISFRTDYSFINLKAGQLIDITSDVYDYTNKVFRIITSKEVEDSDGTISVEFSCLEYDASVYVYDITELAIETDDGILGIGAIGKPDVPLVTLFDRDASPRIEIDAGVPSGIVDKMEYWVTHDTTVGNDVDRIYIIVGTQSNTNGQPYIENDRVIYDYKQSIEADLFVKVRGTNSVTTGPYSDPSGLLQFKPVVVADTVSDDPDAFNGLDIGMLSLMTLLNELMNGGSGIGGIFDEIFNIFEDETGTDIVQDAIDGNLGGQVGPVGPAGPAGSNGTDGVCDCPGPVLPQPDDPCFGITSLCPENDSVGNATLGPCSIAYTPSLIYTALTEGVGSAYLYKSDGTLVQTVDSTAMTFSGNVISIPFNTRLPGTDYYILMDEAIGEYCNGCETECISKPNIWGFTTRAEYEDEPSACGDSGVVQDLPFDIPEYTNPAGTIIDTGLEGDTCSDFSGKVSPVITFDQSMVPGTGTFVLKDSLNATIASFTPCEGTFSGNTVTFRDVQVVPDESYNFVLDSGFGTLAEPAPILSEFMPEESQSDCGQVSAVVNENGYNPSSSSAGASLAFSTPAISRQVNESVPETGSDASTSMETVDLDFSGVSDLSLGTGTAYIYDGDNNLIDSYASADTRLSTVEKMIIISTSPEDDETDVNPKTTIDIEYNLNVTLGTGNFYIYKTTGNVLIQTIDVQTSFDLNNTDRLIEVSGNTITLNPTVYFDGDTEYHIKADATAVEGPCSVHWEGITDNTTFNFTTEPGPILDETATVPTPGTEASINEGIEMTFDLGELGSLAPGSGNVVVHRASDDAVIETIPATDSRVTIE